MTAQERPKAVEKPVQIPQPPPKPLPEPLPESAPPTPEPKKYYAVIGLKLVEKPKTIEDGAGAIAWLADVTVLVVNGNTEQPTGLPEPAPVRLRWSHPHLDPRGFYEMFGICGRGHVKREGFPPLDWEQLAPLDVQRQRLFCAIVDALRPVEQQTRDVQANEVEA